MFVEVEGVSPELGRSPASHVVNSRVMMDLAMLVSNACDLPTDVSPAVSLGVTPEELVREAEELQLRGQHRIVQGSVWDPLDQLQSNQRQQLPTVSATEQPESTTLPPEKQMIYAIVNAFYDPDAKRPSSQFQLTRDTLQVDQLFHDVIDCRAIFRHDENGNDQLPDDRQSIYRTLDWLLRGHVKSEDLPTLDCVLCDVKLWWPYLLMTGQMCCSEGNFHWVAKSQPIESTSSPIQARMNSTSQP